MTLDESRRWCASVMRAHAKSFYFSTRILPRAKRLAVEALYGLFRTADDLADEPGFTRAEREEQFDRLIADLERAMAGEANDAPWSAAIADAFSAFPIGADDVMRLVRACRRDLDPRTIETMADLYAYSADVAGTVGRASMAILGSSGDDSLARGERLGIAMQYTNVLRDIEEDRVMGRNYLPLGEFAGASIGEVMRAVAADARAYYREAAVLASRVPNDGSRAALLMTGEIYGAILERIEQRGFDPTLGRAYVPTREKVRRAVGCLVRSYVGFATIR